jgi:putative cell wall-binding protein
LDIQLNIPSQLVLKGNNMKKDGHTDVASSRRMCKMIIEDANDILGALPATEAELPTWWTNKLAKCSAYMNGARDYLVYSDTPMEEPREEMESSVEPASEGQINRGEYATRHFDICPSAQELYTDIESKTDMVHLIVESMMLHDLLFKLEKQAIAMDNADEDMVEKAQHYADMIMNIAEEMGLKEEHSYIEDVHMAKIKELAEEEIEEDEDDDDMLPPSAKMVLMEDC